MITGRLYSALGTALLLLAALPSAAGAQQRAAAIARAQTPAALGVHGFSVVLVVGSTQPASVSDNVPEAARKALADMKDFLPYKRYQLLDAAWILCCGTNSTEVSGKVRGPDNRDYTYVVDPGSVVGSKLNVRFMMRESLNSLTASSTARLEHSRLLYEAVRERDDAEVAHRAAKQKFDVGVVSGPELEAAATRLRRAEQRAQELQALSEGSVARSSGQGGGGVGSGGGRSAASTSRSVIDSTFSIALGETVVIGTSRLNGDQALIAILTAAAKPGSSR